MVKFKRIYVLRGPTALARFLDNAEGLGEVERPKHIPSPYRSGPVPVWQKGTQKVTFIETRHGRYEIYEVQGWEDAA